MKPLCAILVGKAKSAEQAQASAENMHNCPFVSFYAADKEQVVGIFVLPEGKRWWIEGPEENPDLLGFEKVSLVFSERLMGVSEWYRGSVKPALNRSPCDSDCTRCPYYGTPCEGCPATRYYQPTD